MLRTSCNDRKLLIRASSAHRYVVKWIDVELARVSGMLYDKSILSIENVGQALWVLVEFNLLGLRVTKKFTVVLIMKKCTIILRTLFPLFYSHVPFIQVQFLPAKEKAGYAEMYFCM